MGTRTARAIGRKPQPIGFAQYRIYVRGRSTLKTTCILHMSEIHHSRIFRDRTQYVFTDLAPLLRSVLALILFDQL
jgi:hypothetical protein